LQATGPLLHHQNGLNRDHRQATVLFDPDQVRPPKTEADLKADLQTDGRATGGNATVATRR
jgi:hypothetical protein